MTVTVKYYILIFEQIIMKKKGKSNEDKKLILYDIMLESESFFILKELEALAPKKGIRSIFVKG